LPKSQYSTGFMMQSFFTGLGITLANICLYFFEKKNLIPGSSAAGIPYWVYIAFFIGAFTSISTVLWSVFKTPEIPPTDEELAHLKAQPRGIAAPFKEIISAIGSMPKVMWQLAAVYFFQWYAMFCYWQFISHSIAETIYHTTSKENPTLYREAAAHASLLNAGYNVVTFLTAFALAWYARRIGPKWVHAASVSLAALGLLLLPYFKNENMMFFSMIGLGIGWASMMGVPYLLVVDKIPKERYGVYMGIINMMIVIPMMIQTLTFGFIYKNWIGNQPSHAILFAGVFLLIAAGLTLLIKSGENTNHAEVSFRGGH